MQSDNQVFVIRNQDQLYLDRHGQWCSGDEPRQLYSSRHHDEALNTLIELNARDISLRGQVIAVPLDDKKQPLLDAPPAHSGQPDNMPA